MQPALKRLNSRVIYKATMLSGRLFQMLTARWIKLLPEEYVPVFISENFPQFGFPNKERRVQDKKKKITTKKCFFFMNLVVCMFSADIGIDR